MKPADFAQSILAAFAPYAVTSASPLPLTIIVEAFSLIDASGVRFARSTCTGSSEPSTGTVTSRYCGPSGEPGVAGAVKKSAQLLPVDCTRCHA